MDLIDQPTIVIGLGQTGSAIAKVLAEALHHSSCAAQVSVWTVSTSNGLFSASNLPSVSNQDSHSEDVFTSNSVANLVFDLTSAFLSVQEARVPDTIDRPSILRLTLVGAVWEVSPAGALEFARAFHTTARQHFGSQYITEACLLLPALDSNSGSSALLEEWSNTLQSHFASHHSPVGTDSFNYWWWFDRINTSGRTIAMLPASISDLASVIGALLSISLEQLPIRVRMLIGQPQHMSLGCAEVIVPLEEMLEYLIKRNTCRLVDDLILDRAALADHDAARQLAWSFTSSAECGKALNCLDLSPGGERIWTGFHPIIPSAVDEGNISDFLSSIHEAKARFPSRRRLKGNHQGDQVQRPKLS